MADSSNGDDLLGTPLPDIRFLYDLVTSNNLDAIRSILTPLTLHDRLLVVYQRVGTKNLLYRACELGFKDIAKYLLDECGADIDDGYCDSNYSSSALRLAIGKHDLSMISLLMKRDAALMENHRAISCIYYAFKLQSFTLMSALMVHRNINIESLIASRLLVPGFPRSFSFGFSLYDQSEEDIRFVSAAANGNIVSMKNELANGADRTTKNLIEENALCQTIFMGRWNAMYFLINYRTFSMKEYARALELTGAKFIVFRSNNQRGFECWRLSVRVRRENHLGFLDKGHVQTEIDIGVEFRTEEEIDALRNEKVYFQALLVYLRMLSRTSNVTRSAFRRVALNKIFKDDLSMSLTLLGELYTYVDIDCTKVRYPVENSLEALDELLSSHFRIRYHCKTEDLLKFEKLFDFLDSTWEALPRGSNSFYDIAYEQLLSYVLQNLGKMFLCDLTEEEQQWMARRVTLINKHCPPRYPTTLLHEAVYRKCPLQVIYFLLKCHANANRRNRQHNTPLHVVADLYNKSNYSITVTNMLIEAGAHIDSVNLDGRRPLEPLTKRGVLKNPHQYLSLQCLAAGAIYKFGIDVPEDSCPSTLVEFIKLHSN